MVEGLWAGMWSGKQGSAPFSCEVVGSDRDHGKGQGMDPPSGWCRLTPTAQISLECLGAVISVCVFGCCCLSVCLELSLVSVCLGAAASVCVSGYCCQCLVAAVYVYVTEFYH